MIIYIYIYINIYIYTGFRFGQLDLLLFARRAAAAFLLLDEEHDPLEASSIYDHILWQQNRGRPCLQPKHGLHKFSWNSPKAECHWLKPSHRSTLPIPVDFHQATDLVFTAKSPGVLRSSVWIFSKGTGGKGHWSARGRPGAGGIASKALGDLIQRPFPQGSGLLLTLVEATELLQIIQISFQALRFNVTLVTNFTKSSRVV